MGQVIGHLRQDKATHGETEVLKKLQTSLPKDFYIYVECPLPDRHGHRFPDFIVLSNFGVVVLEVKDWVQIVEADKEEKPERSKPYIPVLGVNPNFTRVTATAIDGTEFTAEVKKTADVIDVEPTEVDAAD